MALYEHISGARKASSILVEKSYNSPVSDGVQTITEFDEHSHSLPKNMHLVDLEHATACLTVRSPFRL
jgi:hypothetical protein